MKILHISRTMGQGGAEKVVMQLCRDNKKHEQIVASCGGIHVEELEKSGVNHILIPDIDIKNPKLMLKTFFVLFRAVKKNHIDIIHTHHRMAAFYGRIISFLTGAKHVYTAHNVFYDKKKLMNFALDRASIVAVGNGVRDNLVNDYSISLDRVTVINNTISPVLTGNKNVELDALRKSGKIVVGTIGRISEQKGIDIFIKAIAKVREVNENVVGVIIGDGEDRNKMQNLARELNLEQGILFLGYQAEVLDLINQLDFVVLSSRWEGLPLTPIEVFSQGKTIIVSNISGNNEVVTDKCNGLLCEKDNVDDFTNKILLLINEKELRTEFEKNAINTYVNDYNYESFIEKYNEVYSLL
ncbi:MAG: glycosyltransferase family 4 protein [Oscillospiraceae bacterium]|nr:glycosyltransferase family 4 protein [Oscillospiraceae bacterium]